MVSKPSHGIVDDFKKFTILDKDSKDNPRRPDKLVKTCYYINFLGLVLRKKKVPLQIKST